MASAQLWVVVVCSSNQNRSMEAHDLLSKKGFPVSSFPIWSCVKLLGPWPDKPNLYDFSTTYNAICRDLLQKDQELYTQNGILSTLWRNRSIKRRPKRFTSCKEAFDLILTCEERVYDQVVRELNSREHETLQLVHVINMDIQDNYLEARLGAFLFSELCQCFYLMDEVDSNIAELLLNSRSRAASPSCTPSASTYARPPAHRGGAAC